jgi:hypothetical protein
MVIAPHSRALAALATVAVTTFLLAQGCKGPKEGRGPKKSRKSLAALPYLSQTPVSKQDRGKVGVTRHDRRRASPGINVYCAETTDGARLLDMEGTVVHRFDLPGLRGCKLLRPHGDRGFLALGDANGLMLIDWSSRVRWHTNAWFHHDFDVAPSGEIYVLSCTVGHLLVRGLILPFTDDEIVVLDPEGRRKSSHSLSEVLRDRITKEQRRLLYEDLADDGKITFGAEKATDILHTNTIHVLKAGELSIAPAGSVLICVRHLDLVAVLDPAMRRVLWSWGPGELDGPHHPTPLPNGNLLIFDNGLARGYSRLIELDPATKAIVWQYRPKKTRFFSKTRGSVQPLEGGNILVAESDRGRLFEITREGEVVWEYWTPESTKDDGEVMRQTVYRAYRWGEDTVPDPHYRRLWRRVFKRPAPP